MLNAPYSSEIDMVLIKLYNAAPDSLYNISQSRILELE